MQHQQQSMMPPRFPGMAPQMLPTQFLLQPVPPRSDIRGMMQFRMQQQEPMQRPPGASLQQMQSRLQHVQPGLRMFPPIPASNSNQMMLQQQFQQQQQQQTQQQQQQQLVQRHVIPPVSSSTNTGVFRFFQCDFITVNELLGCLAPMFRVY